MASDGEVDSERGVATLRPLADPPKMLDGARLKYAIVEPGVNWLRRRSAAGSP